MFGHNIGNDSDEQLMWGHAEEADGVDTNMEALSCIFSISGSFLKVGNMRIHA